MIARQFYKLISYLSFLLRSSPSTLVTNFSSAGNSAPASSPFFPIHVDIWLVKPVNMIEWSASKYRCGICICCLTTTRSENTKHTEPFARMGNDETSAVRFNGRATTNCTYSTYDGAPHIAQYSHIDPSASPLERSNVKLTLQSIPAVRSASYNVRNLNYDLYIAL